MFGLGNYQFVFKISAQFDIQSWLVQQKIFLLTLQKQPKLFWISHMAKIKSREWIGCTASVCTENSSPCNSSSLLG